MPDDDDGWGGTFEQSWTPSNSPDPLASPPPPTRFDGTTGGPGPGAPPRRPNRTRMLVGAGAAVVVAAGVVAVVVLTSNGGSDTNSAHRSTSNRPSAPNSVGVSHSAAPSASSVPTGADALVAIAPFGKECVPSAKSGYDTSAVVDQIVCAGSGVTSAVSATGVSYAKFSSAAGLQSWYSDTILKANGIAPTSGDCATGASTATSGGAQYCEGAFTDDAGATDARQLIVQAPASITLTNGPNSTSADCPNSDFTLLAFTSPSDNVGVIVLSCGSNATAAATFENAVKSGTFDLND